MELYEHLIEAEEAVADMAAILDRIDRQEARR